MPNPSCNWTVNVCTHLSLALKGVLVPWSLLARVSLSTFLILFWRKSLSLFRLSTSVVRDWVWLCSLANVLLQCSSSAGLTGASCWPVGLTVLSEELCFSDRGSVFCGQRENHKGYKQLRVIIFDKCVRCSFCISVLTPENENWEDSVYSKHNTSLMMCVF